MPEFSPLADVAQFMAAMEQPVARGWEDAEGMELGMNLISEEWTELAAAFLLLRKGPADDPALRENFIKELADLLYVAYWLAARVGIDIEAAFARVHASNLSKLDPATGRPLKREDGKALKGPAYRPPDLSDIARNVPITLI